MKTYSDVYKDFLNVTRLRYRTLHLKYTIKIKESLQEFKNKVNSYLPR